MEHLLWLVACVLVGFLSYQAGVAVKQREDEDCIDGLRTRNLTLTGQLDSLTMRATYLRDDLIHTREALVAERMVAVKLSENIVALSKPRTYDDDQIEDPPSIGTADAKAYQERLPVAVSDRTAAPPPRLIDLDDDDERFL